MTRFARRAVEVAATEKEELRLAAAEVSKSRNPQLPDVESGVVKDLPTSDASGTLKDKSKPSDNDELSKDYVSKYPEGCREEPSLPTGVGLQSVEPGGKKKAIIAATSASDGTH